jgi:cell division protein FtsW
MRVRRTEKSLLADWWFSVDRVLLATVLTIIGAGVLLSLAGSPSMAIKRGLPIYYFVERQLAFACASVVVMLTASFLSAAGVRRLALAVLVAALAMMVAVLLTGNEVNGARRWLQIGGHSLQPSELFKPGFVVLSAWLIAEGERRPDMPATALAVGLYVLAAGLLLAQPDVGQTLLLSLVWCALFVLAGWPLRYILAFLAALAFGLAAAYASFSYVRSRIDRFLYPGVGDSFQTDHALRSFIEGGFLGKGPGEGTIKTVLPDAHTDFIFAVIAEEFGVLACLVLLGLFVLATVRVFARQLDAPDAFTRLAAAGLVLVPVLQAIINMAVNVGMIPAKGITLPFISSGGSSMLGAGLGMGMVLALTRRRHDGARIGSLAFGSRPATWQAKEPRPL